MKPQAGGGVEIQIDVMHRVEAPQQRRVMVHAVPEIQRVVEQQETEHDAHGARHRQQPQQSKPAALSQPLHRRHDRKLARRRRRAGEQADRQVPADALRPRLRLPPQRPPPLGDEQGAKRRAEDHPTEPAFHAKP